MTDLPEDTGFPDLSHPNDGIAPKEEDVPILTRGTVLDDFEILEEIGRGGMGIVYKARQISLKRIVALKVIHPQIAKDGPAIRRFQREAVLAANLSHPNIVPVHFIDKEPRPRFLAMEFVEGESLKDIVERDGPLQPDRVVALALQACEALKHAHTNNVIHRDIKPSNLILERESGRLRIADFGIARDVTGRLADVTQTEGSSIGTPAFESPEQNRGSDLDHRTDIFSLGMTLYYLLTGRLAYEGENRQELALAFQEQFPRAPSYFSSEVAPALDATILRMLRADREERPSSAEEVATSLGQFAVSDSRLQASINRPRRRILGLIMRGLPPIIRRRASGFSTNVPPKKQRRRRIIRVTIEISLVLPLIASLAILGVITGQRLRSAPTEPLGPLPSEMWTLSGDDHLEPSENKGLIVVLVALLSALALAGCLALGVKILRKRKQTRIATFSEENHPEQQEADQECREKIR